MSKRAISVVLTVYFLSVLAAVLVRFDEFPWTWVPMYSTYVASEVVSVPVRDRLDLSAGLIAPHRDGSTSRITAEQLNIPSRNYWRIHLQRVAKQGAAKYPQARMNLGHWNQVLWGQRRDPQDLDPVDWNRRVLASLNRTLGLAPADPRFIVRAAAPATRVVVNKENMNILEIRRVAPEVQWSERWSRNWHDDSSELHQ